MKVQLRHRHYGVHELIKEINIDGRFEDYCDPKTNQDYIINEQKLIENLPQDFLPVPPNKILLSVSDDDGGIGQVDLNIFRTWAKYFDSYCIELYK